MLRLAFIAALSLPAAALAQTCTPVTFSDNFTSGAIEGMAPADGVMCYMLDMSGHDGNLGLEIEGQNVMFGYDVGSFSEDGKTEIFMAPQGAPVRVRVSQLSRAAGPVPFRLVISALPGGNG